jgi:murein DD-endopeptidase MepM/ murein hydrolase activator NlpD
MQSFFRRALAVSVAGACLVALGTLTVPVPAAAIAALNEASVEATAQSFAVGRYAAAPTADIAVEAAAARDDFTIVSYSVVQWPLPVGTGITSFFGFRSCEGCSSMHTGIDFTPGAGVPIEAIADGVVVESPLSDGSLGVHLTIEHNVDGVVYRSGYAHLQSGSMTVSVGDTVKRGQVIGLVGNTGQSMGPHLHFMIMEADGTLINPLPWLNAHVNIAD